MDTEGPTGNGSSFESPRATGRIREGFPGEHRLEPALLAEAARGLRVLRLRRGLDTAVAVGRLVLDTFFDGRVDVFRTRGKTHTTFDRLTKLPAAERSFSKAYIYHAVRVLEQLGQLPSELGHALSFSHHKVLLGVEDTATKEALARRAVEAGWTRERLSEEAQRAGHGDRRAARTGRRAVPSGVRKLRRLHRAMADVTAEPIDRHQLFLYMQDQEVEALAHNLEQQLRTLREALAWRRDDSGAERGAPGGSRFPGETSRAAPSESRGDHHEELSDA